MKVMSLEGVQSKALDVSRRAAFLLWLDSRRQPGLLGRAKMTLASPTTKAFGPR